MWIVLAVLGQAATILATPLSDWQNDPVTGASCSATRRYDVQGSPVEISIKRAFSSANPAGIILKFERRGAVNNGTDRQGNQSVAINPEPTITFAPSGLMLDLLYRGTISSGYVADLPTARYVEFTRSTTVTVDSGDGSSFSLPLGSPESVARSLDACRSRRIADWGLDEKQVIALLAKTTQSWFADVRYPPAAKRSGVQGVAVMIVSAGSNGKVSCRVVQSAGAPDLDEASCAAVVKRGSFPPTKISTTRYTVVSLRWALDN
ncbi:energy transducer TonB [Sphingomonas bacterium]|uniref:energy transducer TonB n=1 Tax=Sphingomonas bacterium TaxID=1895847 RepID=UPI002636376D|nr:energy transducer TonB [Sphingomonas bacterium]MDB5678047.1 hypothetical protein [Sphingomonas bacterium]